MEVCKEASVHNAVLPGQNRNIFVRKTIKGTSTTYSPLVFNSSRVLWGREKKYKIGIPNKSKV